VSQTAAPQGVVSVTTRPLGVVLDTRCGVVMQCGVIGSFFFGYREVKLVGNPAEASAARC
jgi:hypothetical protein